MGTFFNYAGTLFDLTLVAHRQTDDDGNYCLELSTIQADSGNISSFGAFSFSSEQERNDFEEELLSKLKRMEMLDSEIEEFLYEYM